MYITTNNEFVPKQFIIYTFYGEETCFCWNEDKVVIFPYTNDNFVSAEVLTAPAPIRSIQCLAGKILFTCIPHGIYKLLKDRKFAVLSKTAIAVGTLFYEVLKPRNKYLYLDNKQDKTNKLLLQLPPEENDSRKLCTYALSVENATEQFIGTLAKPNCNVEHLCIVAMGKRILILMRETVQIIYNSIYSIRDIIPVQIDSKVGALLFLTNNDNIIIMYSKNDTLAFEKIFIGGNIHSLCAGFSRLTENALWFVYSDESKLFYGRKQLSSIDNVQRLSVQDNSFCCLQHYNSKVILGLTMDKQLTEFSTDTIEKTLSLEHDVFINLHPDMLNGTNLIMDKIYKGTQEIHTLNKTLQAEEDKLKRINLYAHKCKIHLCPKMLLHRIANLLFLSVTFSNLPKNSWVILNVKCKNENIFCMKKVEDQETIVDVHIPEGKAVNFSQVSIDLVTLKDKGYSWCLIRDYVTYARHEKNKKKRTRSDKTSLINSKIAMLENFIQEGNIDMKTLSEIKRKVRKECCEL
ncbi:uncharacterized protein LOC116431448 [Nomia melanderi]|uniref:uncharacterized protein LOC116431448 n=1 Tax=Nomia melanderi TaxID=2448451 RepID=UPI0013043DB5|nr:uncharacterized protein LOC116431448 [Nomia melanderi]